MLPLMAVSILLGLLAAQPAHAWGTVGHETVAYIASNFVKSSTKTWAQGILGDTSTNYLANVATWADSYRYTSAGAFSAPYHYIDAEDNPPSLCNVDYNRDCGSAGCSVSAIANYTTRVQSSSLSDTEINNALRFLVHFLGDITQPLHDEALEVGGNDIDVTFAGAKTNLHHIFDTECISKYTGGTSLSTASTWAKNITTAIKSGKYKSQAASWISGDSITNAVSSATRWATDANQYVCSVVMPHGYQTLETGDLSGAYYKGVIDTIELQVAKGGYRLANWLDQLASASSTKRSIAREATADLSGEDLLPPPLPLSREKLARMAVGYDCGHAH